MSWLIGCWELLSAEQNQLIQESWGAPIGNSMLGMSRTVRDGKLLEFESIILRVEKGKLAYEAHPQGQPTATFLSTEDRRQDRDLRESQARFSAEDWLSAEGRLLASRMDRGTVDGKSEPSRVSLPSRRVFRAIDRA